MQNEGWLPQLVCMWTLQIVATLRDVSGGTSNSSHPVVAFSVHIVEPGLQTHFVQASVHSPSAKDKGTFSLHRAAWRTLLLNSRGYLHRPVPLSVNLSLASDKAGF